MNHGKIVLRIDDIDAARTRPEYLEDIFETLHWLEIQWDEGAKDVQDFLKNYAQKYRLSYYEELLEELKNKNSLFACQCSRKQIQEGFSKSDICKNKKLHSEQKNLSWKIDTELLPHTQITDFLKGSQTENVHKCMPDFVVRRKDELPAYQLTSLADDILWKINFIVRGEDLWNSSFAQMYIADLLGKTTFQEVVFFHHPLILDAKGQKLSKSQGAEALKQWRIQKKSPQIIYEIVEDFLEKNTISS
ncbi:MAG: hypothetical protein OHK0038_06290 [Flammeovirgaceae bacterium]